MRDITKHGKLILALGLSALSVTCATLCTYITSLAWRGEWKYPELIAPICALAAAALLAAIGAAHALRRKALIMLGCPAVAAAVFFLLLANCRLSCVNTTIAESPSPDGQWRAIWLPENCTAAARNCPPISHVLLIRSTNAQPPERQEAFTIAESDGVRLEWKSKDLLRVYYPAWTGVLRKRDRIGAVRLEYRSIGWM